VQELNAGLKAFGTLGDWRYGATVGEYAHNGRLRQFGVARVRYQFAERSFLNLLGVRLQGDVQRRYPRRAAGHPAHHGAKANCA
jgi:hypothetical protein